MTALVALTGGGCDGCNNNPARRIADGRADDAGSFHDAAAFDASNPNSDILVTQSPAGPGNGDMATWSGVLQFSVTGDGAALVAEPGLAASALADPAGLAFRSTTSEIFVGNRHGNNAADGTPGSISRYAYDQTTHALVPEPAILGNGLAGVHQVTFSPTTGELFAANVNTAVSRFTFDATGTAIPNGTIASGPTRGVLVAPDGKRLYVSGASATIRQFDLATGTELPATTLTTAGDLHFFALRLGELYVAALDDNKVYRYRLDANDDLTYVDATDAASPIGIAFSADGSEMFVTGHRTVDLLQRYTYDGTTWQPAGTQDLGSSLAGIVIVPG